jgi:hypothetical protein
LNISLERSILLDDDWRIKITDVGSAKVVDPVTLEPVDVGDGTRSELQSSATFNRLTKT